MSKTRSRKRIAIFGVGVIGIPVLTEILTRMTDHFDLVLYSFIPINRTLVPPGMKVRTVPHRMHQRLKYVVLGTFFIIDHLFSRFHLLHSQSAFPGGIIAMTLGKWFDIPRIVTLIGGEVEARPEIPFGDLRHTPLKRLTQKVCVDAQIITVMSQFQADSVFENLKIKNRIEVLPYAPIVKPMNKKEITSPLKLLHVGYHHPVKNHDMLLRVAALLAEKIPFSLTVVGANYGADFERKINALNLQNHIVLAGPQPYESIHPFYRESHILLHTSWYEGLPTVAFEAMAWGTVVVGTHVGIMADSSGETCLTVSVGDDQGMAEAILDLMQNPLLYNDLRNAAYAWAKSHDVNFYIDQMTSFYEELIVR